MGEDGLKSNKQNYIISVSTIEKNKCNQKGMWFIWNVTSAVWGNQERPSYKEIFD